MLFSLLSTCFTKNLCIFSGIQFCFIFCLMMESKPMVEIFLGSKLKPHYYYYLLKPNCRNSMIPSAHILQSPDKSHFAVPASFVKRSKPPKSTYILITVSWAASWSSSHSCHRAVYCQLQHDHQNHCSRHGIVFKPHWCGKKTHGVVWKHTRGVWANLHFLALFYHPSSI